MTRAGVATIVIAVAFVAGCASKPHRKATAAVSANAHRVAARNALPPIELARRFWVAYLSQDENAIRRYGVPDPDLHYTWERTAVFPEADLDDATRAVGNCAGRVLMPRDRYVTNGRGFEMEQYDPSVFCPVYLEWPVEPLCVPCRRDDDSGSEWRVDAGPWIASLRAVERIRQQRAAAASLPYASGADRLREGPERTVRNYMIASVRNDLDGVLTRVMPHPDMQLLLDQLPKTPPADLAEIIRLFEELPVEEMKVGEELGDPFDPGQHIPPAMIDADHLVLRMRTKGPAFWSHQLVRYQNRWLIDMRVPLEVIKRLNAATQPAR
jgi:hypothetical protein